MSTGIRERRVANEWKLLEELAELNSSVVHIQGRCAEGFRIVLGKTHGLAKPGLAKPGVFLVSHEAFIVFPRFFPSVPIEASLAVPVFHPNVHPVNGFVCLWNRFSSGDTVIEAVAQLQRVICWRVWNADGDHVMQPEALAWSGDPERAIALPLFCEQIVKPVGAELARTYAARPGARRRLSLE